MAVVIAGLMVVVAALAICAARMRPGSAGGQGECCENHCGDQFHGVASFVGYGVPDSRSLFFSGESNIYAEKIK